MESQFELKSSKYIVEGFKNFLKKNNFMNKDWNAFNFLPQNASTVGLIDLNILPKEEEEKNTFFNKLKKNQFKLLYLLGSDNLDIKKNNEFIVYQGSHGDICCCFTEQNGRVECKNVKKFIGEALRLENF